MLPTLLLNFVDFRVEEFHSFFNIHCCVKITFNMPFPTLMKNYVLLNLAGM